MERGKEGSQAKHIDTAEFKAKTIIDRAEKRAEETEKQAKTKAEEYLSGIESSIEAERSKPIPKKKKAVEAEIESLRVENAAYKEHFAIKNRDTDYLFEQLQKAERQGKANDTAFRMVPEDICLKLLAKYTEEQIALKTEIEELENALSVVSKNEADVDEFIRRLKRYTDVPELTRELCLELIEYITIGASPDDKTGAREIHIYYKLLGKDT